MKKLYFILLLSGLSIVACKKSEDMIGPEDTTPAQTMSIKLTGTQLFSYNITEADTVTNDFGTKDGYDVTTLDYSFTPIVGHKVTISAATNGVAAANAISATVTYKGKALGPIVPTKGTANTYFTFSYVVPK